MHKIGNIIVNNKVKYDDAFNKAVNIADVDASLPTIIIGFENAKKNIPDFNILNKKYGNIYWTFKKNERRSDYEEDLKKFQDTCIDNIIKDVKYNYLNLINFDFNHLRRFVIYIKSNIPKYIYILPNNKFMFVYDSKTKIVMGISLNLCEYMGVSKEKAIRFILKGSNISKVDNKFVFSELIKPYININPHYILPLYEYFTK